VFDLLAQRLVPLAQSGLRLAFEQQDRRDAHRREGTDCDSEFGHGMSGEA
jgi:hypothetical protein